MMITLAHDLGLDEARFAKDLHGETCKQGIAEDMRALARIGGHGTPTFFINGRELSGAQPLPAFQTIIDEEIKKSDALLKKGTRPDQLYEKLMAEAIAAAPTAAAAAAPSGPTPQAKIDIGDSPVKGPASAKVTVVAFSDFQCPFCSRAVPALKQVEDTYKGKVRIAFKNLPLPFHDHAQMAAEAALAANEQGKFWEYHEKLMSAKDLSTDNMKKLAGEVGIDQKKFDECLAANKFADAIAKDVAAGEAAGVNGTPAFFINGRMLDGAQPFEKFKEIIDEELASAKQS
jgi:protein-disulfide isomerase